MVLLLPLLLLVGVQCVLTGSLSVSEEHRGWIQVDSSHPHRLGVDPEIKMNASQMIISKGFPCEEHHVTTKDGFILGLQRIPHGRHGPTPGPRPVVFLQHGLLGSSMNFLDNLANESLAYRLADAGADVWLGNVRGNVYSRQHTHLQPHQKEFWQWSYDEMAEYDIPAMLEYALSQSGASDLYYVGHSQGTMVGFIAFSTNPDLAAKVKIFFPLAPVAKVHHITSPIRLLAPLAKDAKLVLDLLGPGEFLPSTEVTTYLADTACQTPLVVLCENVFFLLGGFDAQGLNVSRVPVYVAHNPAGTSTQNILHFGQGVLTDKFQKYDFGSAEANMAHYGQPTPPQYNLTDVIPPVVAFYGGADALADLTDVDWLLPQIPHLLDKVFLPDFDHFDFIFGLQAPSLIYDKISARIFS